VFAAKNATSAPANVFVTVAAEFCEEIRTAAVDAASKEEEEDTSTI
jgi:hypothetical protein